MKSNNGLTALDYANMVLNTNYKYHDTRKGLVRLIFEKIELLKNKTSKL
jgi:hypothetical protein